MQKNKKIILNAILWNNCAEKKNFMQVHSIINLQEKTKDIGIVFWEKSSDFFFYQTIFTELREKQYFNFQRRNKAAILISIFAFILSYASNKHFCRS